MVMVRIADVEEEGDADHNVFMVTMVMVIWGDRAVSHLVPL